MIFTFSQQVPTLSIAHPVLLQPTSSNSSDQTQKKNQYASHNVDSSTWGAASKK
jgi:hypothetical protein